MADDKVLPPWFALAVMAASSDRQGQEYGGRTHQGAVLDKRAIGIGRHCARMYATKTRRSMCSELREESSHASPDKTLEHSLGIFASQIKNPAKVLD